MAAAKCIVCDKTVYPVELIKASNQNFHKGCFKCSECKIALNLKTYIWFEGKLYCQKHRPVARASTGADSVSAIHAKTAPKKNVENLSRAHRGDEAHKEGVPTTDFNKAEDQTRDAPAADQEAAPVEEVVEEPAAEEAVQEEQPAEEEVQAEEEAAPVEEEQAAEEVAEEEQA